jgi:hypothetical protein
MGEGPDKYGRVGARRLSVRRIVPVERQVWHAVFAARFRLCNARVTG